MNCPSCEKNSHQIDKCPLLNYTPSQSLLLANYRTQNFQIRKEFKRKLLKKETNPLILKTRLIEISDLLNLKFPEFSQLLELEPTNIPLNYENSEISIEETPLKSNNKAVRWDNYQKKNNGSFYEESPVNEMPNEEEQSEKNNNKGARWEGLKKKNTASFYEESSVNEFTSLKFVESNKEIDENMGGTQKNEILSDIKIDHMPKNIKLGIEPKTPIELRNIHDSKNMRTSSRRKTFIKEKDKSR